jgi:transcriptional regulator of arginine metabolism
MQKTDRLLAIEKLITEESISSQYELLKKLKSAGIGCTQATLSRNLKQLGVSRGPDGMGGYKYFLSEVNRNAGEMPVKLNIVPVIHKVVEAKGLIVIRTIPGNASATAFLIDNADRYEIAGTIAGDDTILIIPRDGISLQQIHNTLELILPGLHDQIKNR